MVENKSSFGEPGNEKQQPEINISGKNLTLKAEAILNDFPGEEKADNGIENAPLSEEKADNGIENAPLSEEKADSGIEKAPLNPISEHLRYTTKIAENNIETYNPLLTFTREHRSQGQSFSYRVDTRYDYYKRLNRIYRQAVTIQELEQAQLIYNILEEALIRTVKIYHSSDWNNVITIAEAKSQLVDGEREALTLLEQLEQTYSTPMSNALFEELRVRISQIPIQDDVVKQALRNLKSDYESDTLDSKYALFVEDLITKEIIKNVK